MFKFNSQYLTDSFSLQYQFPNILSILAVLYHYDCLALEKYKAENCNSQCFNQSRQCFYSRAGVGCVKQMRQMR